MGVNRVVFCCAVVSTAWALSASHVSAGVVLQSGSGKIDQVTAVTIDGTTYDATFYHGVSFSDLGGASIIEFSTDAAATTAINAVMTEIANAAVDVSAYSSTNITNLFLIPFNDDVDAKRAAWNSVKNPLGYQLLTNLNNQPRSTAIQSENAYLTFQDLSSVPEPHTSLFIVAAAAAACLRRRYGKKRLDSP